MKVRLGFVSNSSSSSFSYLGIRFSNLEDKIKVEIEDTYDFLEDKFGWESEETFISYTSGIEDYYDDFVIGVSVDNLKDEETILEAKIKIANEINKVLDTNISEKDISFHTDGGHD